MFTKVHKNIEIEDMKQVVSSHLVNMMTEILKKNHIAIDTVQKAIMLETANADIEHLEREGNLFTYYCRFKKGQI